MKSIMEQASSIIKAIEKAWISADKPKEFSVKIFEQEEKNFFGMTTKPAKIGIFFSDKNTAAQDKHAAKNKSEAREQTDSSRPEKPETGTKRPEQQQAKQKTDNKQRPTLSEKPKTDTSITKPQQQNIQAKQPKPTTTIRPSSSWNNAMADVATEWVKKTLTLMGKNSDLNITSETTGKILKLTFSQPLIENPLAEKNLFRSIAHLVMASLRNQYKQEIKDLKIVLLRQQ